VGLRALEDDVHNSQRNDDAKHNRDDGDPKRNAVSQYRRRRRNVLLWSRTLALPLPRPTFRCAQNGSRGHRKDGKRIVQEGDKRCKSHIKSC